MVMQVDHRGGYGEQGWVRVAPQGARLYTVVFTMRHEEIPRIIDLHRATNSEIEPYRAGGRK